MIVGTWWTQADMAESWWRSGSLHAQRDCGPYTRLRFYGYERHGKLPEDGDTVEGFRGLCVLNQAEITRHIFSRESAAGRHSGG